MWHPTHGYLQATVAMVALLSTVNSSSPMALHQVAMVVEGATSTSCPLRISRPCLLSRHEYEPNMEEMAKAPGKTAGTPRR